MTTPDQNAALQDALARAKQIAAKLQQQGGAASTDSSSDESRKRSADAAAIINGEPFIKKPAIEDATDPKALAMQVAQNLVARAGLGSMVVEEIQVPNKFVGLIIGRGGEMINKLQSESSARIQVAPDPPPDQVVEDRNITVTGTPDAVARAKDIINKIVLEGKVPDHLIISSSNPGEFVMEYMVPSNKVGLIIGKGGETIRSLQERASCKMVLIQDGQYANAGEKPLRISGDQQKCAYGKQLVIDLLTEKELEAMTPENSTKQNADGTLTQEHHVPREAVGFVIGRHGETIKAMQMEFGCKIVFKNDMGGPTKIAIMTGLPDAIAKATERIEDIVKTGASNGRYKIADGMNPGGGEPRGPRPQGFGGPRFGGPPGGPRGNFIGGGAGGPQQPLLPGQKIWEIQVPRNKCGLVIGRGGETLKKIHEDSGVTIEINRNVPDNMPFRAFSLQGDEEQVRKAEMIIRDKISDPNASAKPVEIQGQHAPGGGPQFNGGPGPRPQWGGPGGPSQWGGPQGQPGWNQQQPGGPGWNQQQPNQGGWPGQQQPGNWNQPPQPQPWQQQGGPAAPAPQGPGWNQPQQQQPWQQPQQGQWGGQPWSGAPAAQPAAAPPAQTQPPPTTDPATGQPDYSAAWAAYYQYCQQYGIQAVTPSSSATASTQPTAAPAADPAASAAAVAAPTSTAGGQSDYSAQWAQYYRTYYPGYQQQAGGAAPAPAPQ